MIDTLTPARPTAAQKLQAKARSVYRASYALGDPMSGEALGAQFERSETWGLDRIREVKAELQSSPVALTTSSLPPVTTPPSLPQSAPTKPAEPQQEPQAAPEETAVPTAEPQPAPAETAAAPTESAAPQEEPQPARAETAGVIAAPQEAPAAPAAPAERKPTTPLRVWPVWLLLLPASVAIWSGWVGLGEKAGFGPVQLLPGIANVEINTAITLPIGMEVYSAYALYVWLSGQATGRALTFARISAIIALLVGALGQVAYHVMEAAGVGVAPWWITAGVACLPVGVVGLGAALAHMVRAEADADLGPEPGALAAPPA